LWATNFAKGDAYGLYLPYNYNTGMLNDGSVATDDSGNIYVSAIFDSANIAIGPYTLTNSDITGNTSDIFAAKFSPSGVVAWATSVGGSANDFNYAITVATTGEVYIAGDFY